MNGRTGGGDGGLAAVAQSIFQRPPRKRKRIHYLHVSKAAGSQITEITQKLNEARGDIRIVKRNHEISLKEIPEGEGYFFSTRDPITRFRSGFYSRFREGRPRHHSPWSPHERIAFGHFRHANELAEALFEPGEAGLRAAAAIRSLRHPSRNLVDWFKFNGELFHIRPPIWIVRQERFENDMRVLFRRLGLGAEADDFIPETRTHANDYAGTPDFSEKAKENLRRWYAQDFEFLRLCDAWMEAAG